MSVGAMKDYKDGVFVFFRLVSFFRKKGKKRNWRVTLRHDGVKIFNSMRWHWTREMLLGFRARRRNWCLPLWQAS